MINFKALPPVDRDRRKAAAPKVTALLSGAKFEFIQWTNTNYIQGRYLDFTGEWVVGFWNEKGRVEDSRFPEMGLDWSTART